MAVSFQITLENLQTIQYFSILSLHCVSFNVAHKNFPMKTTKKFFFISFCGSVLVLCLMHCSNVSKLWETHPGALQLCVRMLPGLEVQPHGTAHHEGKAFCLLAVCCMTFIVCVQKQLFSGYKQGPALHCPFIYTGSPGGKAWNTGSERKEHLFLSTVACY